MLESLFNKVAALKACDFIKKETPTLMFFCEYREIFKNTFFIEYLRRLFLHQREYFHSLGLKTDRLSGNLAL